MEQLCFIEEINNNKKASLPIVLSASRMTDMPKYYPDELIYEVEKRMDKGMDIHTLVLWTKHPGALLTPKLKEFILKLISKNILIYLQCTITGMGGTILEPNAKPYQIALDDLKCVTEFIGGADKVRLRVDPLVRIYDQIKQESFDNFIYFEKIIKKSIEIGITTFSISFLEKGMHQKVDRRMSKLGWRIQSPNEIERIEILAWLNTLSKKYNISVEACSVKRLPESKCIDGRLLQKLHPLKRAVRLDEPKSRSLCGCTHSIDIGGWPPKKCFTGCQYCYANAKYVGV